jgi:TolA-binding protein
MNVGEGMGRAMAELILRDAARKTEEQPEEKATAEAPGAPEKPTGGASAARAEKLYRAARDAERAGQRGLARTFYKRIVDKYPDTPAARKAAERLK